MIKVNARVLQLVKHHDCSIYFRYSITRVHTYVIVILCVLVATYGHLTSYHIKDYISVVTYGHIC